MINLNNNSNTYDKSTLDAKFKAITDKLQEIKLSLSSCVTRLEHNKDIADSINNALSTLPKHYVTYEELLVYLKDYVTEQDVLDAIKINEDTVTMINDGKLGLKKVGDELQLFVTAPYIAPTASLSITPQIIEYNQLDPEVELKATVSDANKIKTLFISGGTLSNEDITYSRTITDTVSNTEPTTYVLTFINDQDQSKQTNCSTKIGKRILYGIVLPTLATFSSIESMKKYPGTSILTDSNPSSISITQDQYQYGWIATPWQIESFVDTSVNFPGGWLSNTSDGQLSYTEYDSPYGDGKYYVYRTTNSGLGTVNWKIVNKQL